MARSDELSVGDEAGFVGAIGAFVVAFWYLIIDTIAGHPLRTPSVLGQVLLFGQSRPSIDQVDFGAVVAYTAVHFGLFFIFGYVIVRMVHWAIYQPIVRYALLQVFLVFEVFFYGVIAFASVATRALFPFWTVLIANTLAALAMGYYLWRTHPAARRILRETPLGDAPLE
jgi:hypothetical protein